MINIEERVAKAKRLFKEEGYNCCQAVVLAYNDVFGIDDDTAAALSSGFGGGMGRMREVCGSVSGMVMLAGLMAPAADPSIKVDRTRNYALIQDMAEEFRAYIDKHVVFANMTPEQAWFMKLESLQEKIAVHLEKRKEIEPADLEPKSSNKKKQRKKR